MTRLAAVIVILYVVLKGVQLAVAGAAGYRAATPSLGTKLRRGEPWLVLFAVLMPALVLAYSQWWVHRWAARGFAHATDCIGQLSSLERLPKVYALFGRQNVSESALSYYSLAHDQGRQLRLDPAAINALINRRQAAYADRYARLTRSRAQPAIDEQFRSIDRCLRDDWPHDGLLNP